MEIIYNSVEETRVDACRTTERLKHEWYYALIWSDLLDVFIYSPSSIDSFSWA